MGYMKEFAARLATMIYYRKMKDEEILHAMLTPVEDEYRNEYAEWVMEQIYIVRDNPELYKPMAGSE